MDTESPPSSADWAGTLDDWRMRGRHRVELPSSQRVVVRTVTLDELAAANGLPDDLVRVALAEIATDTGAAGLVAEKLRLDTPDGLKEARQIIDSLAELTRRLVVTAVVEPQLTDVTVRDLPPDDLAMIAAIATRRVQFDAAGRRVGVEPLDTFATFRREHGCDEDCPHCAAARMALSSVRE